MCVVFNNTIMSSFDPNMYLGHFVAKSPCLNILCNEINIHILLTLII